jgi:AhpD family alkylhydroperoxidase
VNARIPHPAITIPAAMTALHAFQRTAEQGAIPKQTIDLVQLRASQINGCGGCVDMDARAMKQAGETDDRLFAVADWRDVPYFTDAERAALALSECVTRLSDRPDPAPDDVWNEAVRHFDEAALAALLIAIASINVWNRFNVAIRQPAVWAS